MYDKMTIHEAAELWVDRDMSAISRGMIEICMSAQPDEWREVTTPARYDRVIVNDPVYGEWDGEIAEVLPDDLYRIHMDNGEDVDLNKDEFYIDSDDGLPMWGTMWQMNDICDQHWLEEKDGIRILSECGFRVYESDEFGYFFGIDGAGYDFYESHWIPLYKARGLRWHDPAAEQKYQMECKGYKIRNLGMKQYWMDGDRVVDEVLESE